MSYHISRPLCCLMFFISFISADSKSETVNQTIAEDEGSSDSEELSQSLLPQVTWRLEFHMWWLSRHGFSHFTIFHHLMNFFFILQTPLKSCPTTPVKILYTPHPRKEKPAVLVSPVTAVANNSSATTDMPGHVNNTLSMVRLMSLLQMQIKSSTIKLHWQTFSLHICRHPKQWNRRNLAKTQLKAKMKSKQLSKNR